MKELLGHSTVVVTMRYAHTNEEAKTKAVNAISRANVTVMPKPRRLRHRVMGSGFKAPVLKTVVGETLP